METKQWNFVDKSDWPRGPWDIEPDKMQWTDPSTGLPCLIVRGPMGALCGYVGVPPEHKLHGKSGSDDALDLDVHGGITFTNSCSPTEKEHGVCHIAGPGEPDDVWWFGFDCAHAWDMMPYSPMLRLKQLGALRPDLILPDLTTSYVLEREEYRDIAYVQAECSALALQLVAVK